MQFLISDNTFSAIRSRNASVETAEILGRLSYDDGSTDYFLDRIINVRPNEIPEGWRVRGVVSSIVTEKGRGV